MESNDLPTVSKQLSLLSLFYIFQDSRDWKEIYDHILNTLIGYLEMLFGDVGVPSMFLY